MDKIFLRIINMSITANYAIVFVMAIRLLLKRFPKIFSYMLWAVVLFRLICPFSFEGFYSLMPANVHIPNNIAYLPKPEINSGIASIDGAVNNLLPPANPAASANPMQIWIAVGETIWIIGIAALLVYSIYAAARLHIRLQKATFVADNIYRTDKFATPFVFGIIRPGIYLPAHLSESESSYILLHEQTHIRCLDHIIKPVSFLVTCVHWFNPLVWIAFFLMGEDMELSCDERVIRQMGSDIKREYSSSLLSLSTGRRIVGGCPLAFGENNTKGRIKNVLKYKKPDLWVVIIAGIAVIAVIAGLMANPKHKHEAETWDLKPMIMVNGELYLDTGKEMPVEIDESAIIGKVKSSVDGTEKPTEDGQTNFGLVGAEYAHFEDNIVVLINNEWVLFEKEMMNEDSTDKTDDTSYDKIKAYLEEECKNVFSPYYELLGFEISDYQEEVVNGNVEAVFYYKVIHKNYDRDPDTVEYIKKAKESGDSNYQQLYDEYLKPQEMNFYFKAVIDENDVITLYYNSSPHGVEWEEVKMSDYIIK